MPKVDLSVRQLTFPSGLRVVAERDARTKIAGLFLVVGAGSSSDPAGKEGLAHYVEHLAFRSRPFGKSSFRRLLERADAAEWDARTSFDATLYHEVGPASALPEMLRLEGARMVAPIANVTPEILAAELDVVRSELRASNESGFSGEMFGALQKAVFPPGHPYAHPVIGTNESLTSIQAGDIRDFVHAHYEPRNMTLAIVGDIDLATIEGVVRDALPPELLRARTFKPRESLAEPAPEPPNPSSRIASRSEASVASPEIWIGWSLPRAFDANIHLAQMMARDFDERLHGVQDDDIASTRTTLVPGKDASMLVCRVVLSRGHHPDKSLERVLDRAHLVWNEETNASGARLYKTAFESRKRWAIANMWLETEDLVAHGTARALTTHFSQNPSTYTRGVEKVMDLEEAPFVAYARKYFARERARAVFFTPAPGGAMNDARPIGAHAIGEEDSLPLRVDEDRLLGLAPPPGVGGYQQFTLPNGLDVIVGRREGAPSVSVALLVRGGWGDAASPAAARAAFTLGRSRDLRADAEDLGELARGQLGQDKAVYDLDGGAGNVRRMIGILAESVRSRDVDKDDWKDFLDGQLSHWRVEEQRPDVAAGRIFRATLFSGHPYARSWTADALESSSPKAAQNWIEATHRPDNSSLVIVGAIDSNEVAKVVRDEFSVWKPRANALSGPRAYEPAQMSARSATKVLVTGRHDATQVRIQLGCIFLAARTAADDTRHEVTAKLVEDRLGEILGERVGVMPELRVNAYGLRGGTAYLDLQSALERGKLTLALKGLQEGLRNLGEAPPSDRDLAWAKLRAARARTTAYVTNHDVAYAILRTVNLGYPVASLDGAAKDIAAATAKDVAGDVRACTAGGLTLSLVGDEPSIRAALKEAGL